MLYIILFIVAICFCFYGFLGHVAGWTVAALCFFAATMVIVGKRNK